jgi:hypothetical protein
MSLIELKQVAKTLRIKQYYIMKRHQLIHILSMTELPASFKIEKLTIHQLRDEAKQKGIRGFWTLRREQLVDLLYPITPNKEEDDPQKNGDPESNHPDEVGVKDV